MDFNSLIDPFKDEHGQLLFRWIHILAGVVWIGLLYFFNWVNSAFAPTMDSETKKKVVPELMPRALFWFRWGAAWTWISGIALLFVVYYINGPGLMVGDSVPEKMVNVETSRLLPAVWGMALLGLIVGFLVYDVLSKQLAGQLWPNLLVWGAIVVAYAWWLSEKQHFPDRAVLVHCGAMFGTAMAANVWMRIWPAQQRIITAIKGGDAPDGADLAMAGLRSKHNTYMSVPLLLFMLSPDQTKMHISEDGGQVWLLALVVMIVGFVVCDLLYKKAAKVPGF